VGLISDTHGLMRPEALAALRGVDRIVHAGDVGAPEVLAALRRLAPVVAVRGNNDRGAWAERLPERATLTVGGRTLLVVHDRKVVRETTAVRRMAAVVSGHSHKPALEWRDGVLWVNPGSAGPRRFSLPVAVARLLIADDGVRAEIVELDASPRA
jgi:putative phosphoesterase